MGQQIELIKVALNSNYYLQGVTLRKRLFFDGFKNAQLLIDDPLEAKSIHIVVLKRQMVIGTGRLTFLKNDAIISQMTVHPENQNIGIGSAILKELVRVSIAKIL